MSLKRSGKEDIRKRLHFIMFKKRYVASAGNKKKYPPKEKKV